MAEFDVDRETARVSEQVDQAAEHAKEQFARVGSVSGRAESGDGAISVEVNPGGLLTSVRLSHAALRSGCDAVAQHIMELSRTATRRAGDRMHRALSPVLGAAGEDQLRSLGYEPFPEDEDDDGSSLTGYYGR